MSITYYYVIIKSINTHISEEIENVIPITLERNTPKLRLIFINFILLSMYDNCSMIKDELSEDPPLINKIS